MATDDIAARNASPSREQVPAIVVRARITDEEWKALRAAAIRRDCTVETIVGSLISDYLWANGYIGRKETGR